MHLQLLQVYRSKTDLIKEVILTNSLFGNNSTILTINEERYMMAVPQNTTTKYAECLLITHRNTNLVNFLLPKTRKQAKSTIIYGRLPHLIPSVLLSYSSTLLKFDEVQAL